MLEVEGLTRRFGDHRVLDSVDLTVGQGEVVVVRGLNGAGKSTLLECLAGAQPFDAGTMRLDGSPVTTQSRAHWTGVHGVLDDFAWLPDLTVLDHLRLLDPSLDATSGRRLLDVLGAATWADRLPLSLSSGQRQRCALASAAARPWRLLLVDEPERHLDADVLPLVGEQLRDLAQGRAVVVATHAAHELGLDDARSVVVRDGGIEDVA